MTAYGEYGLRRENNILSNRQIEIIKRVRILTNSGQSHIGCPTISHDY